MRQFLLAGALVSGLAGNPAGAQEQIPGNTDVFKIECAQYMIATAQHANKIVTRINICVTQGPKQDDVRVTFDQKFQIDTITRTKDEVGECIMTAMQDIIGKVVGDSKQAIMPRLLQETSRHLGEKIIDCAGEKN